MGEPQRAEPVPVLQPEPSTQGAPMTNEAADQPQAAEPSTAPQEADQEVALPPEPEPMPEEPVWQVAGSKVNARAGPSTSYEVLATLTFGEGLQQIELDGDWGRFSWENGEGWIFLDLVEPR